MPMTERKPIREGGKIELISKDIFCFHILMSILILEMLKHLLDCEQCQNIWSRNTLSPIHYWLSHYQTQYWQNENLIQIINNIRLKKSSPSFERIMIIILFISKLY